MVGGFPRKEGMERKEVRAQRPRWQQGVSSHASPPFALCSPAR
jgi:hypothetical protein